MATRFLELGSNDGEVQGGAIETVDEDD